MAQLAHAGSAIMDEFNSAFSQCMPPPGLTMKSDYLAGGGYTPSLLTAPLHPAAHAVSPCTGGVHAQPQVAPTDLPAAKPKTAKPSMCFIKVLGWLGVAMAGVIIVAVFLRRRMFVSNEQNNNVPLITETSLYMEEEPAAPRVVEVVEEDEEDPPEDPPEAKASGIRRVRFDDEEHVAPPAAAVPEEEDAAADADADADADAREEEEGRGDPNFTPMKLDML